MLKNIGLKLLNSQIHLWLGLISGLLVFFICISGAIYTFSGEIFSAVHKNYLYLNKAGQQTIPLDDLWKIAGDTLGSEHPISYVNTFSDSLRSWEFKAYSYNGDAVGYFSWCEYDYIVYINPYTGEVLKILDHKLEFFQLVKMFHWSFWLNTKYGQPIVGWTVVVFVICLITGLILWWPFKRKNRKNAFAVSRTKKWNLLNYDLHNFLGFYSSFVSFILAFTGMVWAFKWFMTFVYIIGNMGTGQPENIAVASADSLHNMHEKIYEVVYQKSIVRYPNAYSIMISPYGTEKTSTIRTYIKLTKPVYYKAYLEEFDKYSGKLIHSKGFDDLNGGEKIIYMNYDIHVGAILGFPGKIIVFLAAIIAASLPLTGFFIWWNKRKQKKKLISDLVDL
jgi:uncharacterized iron-regulated membrane protein